MNALTVATSVPVPGAEASATIVTVAEAVFASVASVQVTVWVPEQSPVVAVALAGVRPAGRVSVTVTPSASPEPVLVTWLATTTENVS